jgi:hypothetical protein
MGGNRVKTRLVRSLLLLVVLGASLPACGAKGNPATDLTVSPSTDGDGLHPPANGPVETIATGRVTGWDWELTGYESGEGLCVDLHLGSNSAGGCGSGGSRKPLRVGSIDYGSDLPNKLQVHGQLSGSVTSLRAKFSGMVQEVRLHFSERFDRTFFVVFLPKEEGGRLIARNSSGRVLAREAVPPADF